MTLSLYAASVPPTLRTLSALSAILVKGAAHAEAKKIDPQVLLQARLFPDMFPLVRQVQIATDAIKGGVSRLAGEEPPRFEDDEANFAELTARIARTQAHLESFLPEQIDGNEERSIVLKLRGVERTFQGQAYLLGHVLPNFYFHTVTAYNILRHNGVELGKQDYLGS